MRFRGLFVALLGFGSLVGCSQAVTPSLASKGSAGIERSSTQEAVLDQQAQKLSQLSNDILRKSTLKGAAIGAAVGCGLSAISASGAGRCAQAALVGGAVGGAIGHAQGRQSVEKRIELVDLNRVMPAISKADDQMKRVQTSLDAMLATQAAELDTLKKQRALGHISQSDYDARIAQIRSVRADIAEVLLLSERDLAMARDALEEADQKGQAGVAWYLQKTQQLEQHATSARSALSLI